MFFNCSTIPTYGGKLSSAGGAGGEGGAQLAMTHLFLEQIFREALPICQEAAKGWGHSQEGHTPYNF